MTTEAVKTDAENNKTQSEVQGAQTEKGLDELLKEFGAAQPQKSETKTETKTEPVKADAPDSDAVALRAAALMQARNDYSALAKSIAEETGADLKLIESTLRGEFSDKKLETAFLQGDRTKVGDALKKKIVAGFAPAAAKQAEKTSDKVMVRAAARTQPRASDKPAEPIDYRRNPQAFRDRKRQLGISR